ncbi:MAG: choice-of-anchor tandem repeat GloVer-containing protein [Verrucomicrobiota bacterium]
MKINSWSLIQAGVRNAAPMALLAVMALVLSATVLQAQTFTVLTNFPDLSGSPPTNQNGGEPDPTLVLSGNTLYGLATYGGTNGDGTLFSVNTDGAGYTVLDTFQFTEGNSPGGLLLSGSVLYGLAGAGGASGSGSVFSLGLNGAGFSALHDFAPEGLNEQLQYTNSDGAGPAFGLVLAGTTLYGVTVNGGTNGSGTVFSVKTDKSGFKLLHVFGPAGGANAPGGGFTTTNQDGYKPNSPLVLIRDTLYGVTSQGSTNGYGTLFSVNTNGDDFQVLHAFSAPDDSGANFDGAIGSGLAWTGSKLCGTTQSGGTNGWGAVFAVDTSGSNYIVLHTFKPASYVNSLVGDTNADGAAPQAGLTIAGNTLYGTTSDGGTNGAGTLFSMAADGSGFTVLHTMARIKAGIWADGEFPGRLVEAGNVIYGTAFRGGPSQGNGTIFSLSLPAVQAPPFLVLAHLPGSATLTLFWPNTATGFVLESNPNLDNPAGWQSFQGTIFDTNGQLAAQIEIAAGTSFFRLNHQ